MILKEVRREGSGACESTEDLLAAIEEINRDINEEQLTVGSLDVKSTISKPGHPVHGRDYSP